MESSGVVGSIQVSKATYDLIQDEFVATSRGALAVKGKGVMETFVLVSHR